MKIRWLRKRRQKLQKLWTMLSPKRSMAKDEKQFKFYRSWSNPSNSKLRKAFTLRKTYKLWGIKNRRFMKKMARKGLIYKTPVQIALEKLKA